MKLSCLYYSFLKQFDGGRPISKKEIVMWYMRVNDVYPFGDINQANVIDAWSLPPNTANPAYKMPGDFTTQMIKRIRSLAERTAPNSEIINTGEYCSGPEGELIEIMVCNGPANQLFEVLPLDHRRKIESDGNSWYVNDLNSSLVKRRVGGQKSAEEKIKTYMTNVSNREIRAAEKRKAVLVCSGVPDGATLDLGISLIDVRANKFSGAKTLTVSYLEDNFDPIKKAEEQFLLLVEDMKNKDAKILAYKERFGEID